MQRDFQLSTNVNCELGRLASSSWPYRSMRMAS